MSLPNAATQAPGPTRYCGSCGAPHAGVHRFCAACGQGIQQGPIPEPVVPSPGRPVAAPLAGAINAVVNELQRLPIKTVVPLRAWWDDGVWRRGATSLFMAAAVAPFLLLRIGNDGDVKTISWGFSLYFAGLWFIAVYTLVRPPELDWPLLAKVAIFTIVAGVSIAVGLEKNLTSGDMNLATYIFGVGLPEELAKALPIYLFLYRGRGRQHPLRTYLFVGAVSGLAFGASEAVTYSQAYAQMLPYVDSATAITTEIWRLVTDSLFHACMAGITAFFIGLAAHFHGMRAALMSFGLAFAAILHGVYDNFSDGWLGTAIAVLIVFVFIGYVHSGERIGEHLAEHAAPAAGGDAAPGRSPA
jgi:RsiW-degrading membrane proteinase PrsW (M82 family)